MKVDIALLLVLLGLVCCLISDNNSIVSADDLDGIDINDLNLETSDETAEAKPDSNAKDQPYLSPKIKPDNILLFESFDDKQQFKTNWIQSKDSKYEGQWQLNSGPDRPHADMQLLLPQKARHYAISSKLNQPFRFSDGKPLVVQYEAQFREGLDCGGAYVKLLRQSALNDLSKLTDKTPFTIMFGPDKCGSEAKLHFILQYLNPKTNEHGEKHWKQAKYVTNLMSTFSDKKHHLYKLVLEPNNNFEIFLDDKSVGKGNLLEDLDPAINPPKEIVDANDSKPADWDERAQIDDPNAKKPDDWDEDAPKTIEDPNATKPDDWLENEPKYIPDPEAKKPDDWEEMDGDWEAPLIENPVCSKVSGCGEWKAPMVPNPNYKGKWRPSKIDNPNYKGKWSPRMIPNPDYFFDENPFLSLDPIGAIAFELWSMADNVAFDNLIIASDVEPASLLEFLTWRDKKAEADANSPSLVTRSLHYLKVYPWLWAVLVLAVALPLFLFISYCCDTKRRRGEAAHKKKTDESKPDKKSKKDQNANDEAQDEGDDANAEEDDQVEVDDEESLEEDEEDEADAKTSTKQVRRRKKN